MPISSGTTRGGEWNQDAHPADDCPDCQGDQQKAAAHEAELRAQRDAGAISPGLATNSDGHESRVKQGDRFTDASHVAATSFESRVSDQGGTH